MTTFTRSTRIMIRGAIQEDQVIAARGGQPASTMGKFRCRACTMADTAGCILPRNASKMRKTPAKPMPTFKDCNRALPRGIRDTRAIMKNSTGNNT
jgi:hypothetical protein